MTTATQLAEDVGSVQRIARERIRRFAAQPRKHFDPAKLRELASSIKAEGQKVPIKVKPVEGDPAADFELVDGERRWLACDIAGVPMMIAWVAEVVDEEEQFVDSVVANFGREGHTPLETARAIVKIMAGKRLAGITRTAQIEHAAKLFARSPAWIYLHLNLLNLHPEVQAMLEPDAPEGKRLGFSIATFLNNVRDQALQLEIAAEIAKRSLKTNQARALIRRMAERAGHSADKRGLRPSDHFKVLQAFVARLGADAERVLDMPFREFGALLARRTPRERQAMLSSIDEGIAQLQQIRDALVSASAAT
jgi:ParB family chromosome partitioning protein